MRHFISPYVYIGYHCNNNCIFCSEADGYYQNLSLKPLEEIKDDILKVRNRYNFIRFMGREGTLRNDIAEIIRFARTVGFKDIGLTTNGRRFYYEPFANEILSTGITQIGFSLCGPDPSTHDYQTKIPGSFLQTIQGIKNIKELGDSQTKILVNIPLNKKNYRTLEKMLNLVIELRVDEVNLLFVAPLSQRSQHRCLIMPMKKLGNFVLNILKKRGFLKENGIKVLLVEFLPCALPKENRNLSFQCMEKNPLKIRMPLCRTCPHAKKCDGVLKTYLDLYGDNEFKLK